MLNGYLVTEKYTGSIHTDSRLVKDGDLPFPARLLCGSLTGLGRAHLQFVIAE